MNEQVFPTKGNLIQARKFLAISNLGYELLDRKRNILIREMMQMIDEAKSIRGVIEETYIKAYDALQDAHITLGVIDKIVKGVPIEKGINVTYRSVMGVEIPKVSLKKTQVGIPYGFYMTNSELDNAYVCFNKVKEMTVVLAEVENGIFRLATAVKQTQKRANALKNILIPRFENMVKYISDSLEEKEREDFSRLKVIKVMKRKKK
ncbi:MAG: V-type ATP synthase subunit D [Clostridiales bacterium]|nr:V-type ATP synthase subunit D [Clostridiales bacterium]